MVEDYAERKLAEYGFGDVEIIIDEWNYMDWSTEDRFDAQRNMPGATCVASIFCTMQNTGVSKMMFYTADPMSHYGGLYLFPGYQLAKTYYVFRMFNSLYRLGTQVESFAPEDDNCFALAATDGKNRHAMLITNVNDRERILEIAVTGAEGRPECIVLDSYRSYYPTATLWQGDGKLRMPGRSVVLLEWK